MYTETGPYVEEDKPQRSANIFLNPDSVAFEWGNSGHRQGKLFYTFLGSCNQLGAAPEQLHSIQKIQTIQYQVEQPDASVAGMLKPPIYHKQEWNAMVYGCGMASETIL